jgi:A/G-specific adenine glycosylase
MADLLIHVVVFMAATVIAHLASRYPWNPRTRVREATLGGYPCGVTPPADSLKPDDAAVPPALRDAILAWYAANGRPLAFRRTTDPYAVLVSELMAQQTQAERAAEAWERWIARWPTASALAEAPVAEVLRAWAGLGYNRRALALHRAAKAIVAQHGGAVPASVEALQALPGVGAYTARAVAALAFGQRVGAVDVNVRRVLGRIAAGGADGFTAASMQVLADAVVPHDAAGWTHALMDIGATLCKPRDPACASCPAARWCRYAAGDRPASAVETPAERHVAPAFEATTRWLRGRILARARDAADGEWVRYGEPMGTHGAHAVREAVTAMAAEGLLEARDTTDGPHARLPQ